MSQIPKTLAIKDVSTSDYVEYKLHQLDLNGDGNLVTEEVASADGYLLCHDVVGSWDFATQHFVERTLLNEGLISKIREDLCPILKVVIKEDVLGNTETGHVFHFAQRHRHPNAGSVMTKVESMRARYQFDILRQLLAMDIKHVFDETQGEDIEADFWQRYGIKWSTEARQLFMQGQLSDTPTPEQLDFLFHKGASVAYALLRDGVHLHTSRDPAIEGQLRTYFEKLNRHETRSAADSNLIFALRERAAVSIIMAFLRDNPGQNIALIYGRAHDFTPHFKSEIDGPKFSTVKFPDAFQRSENVMEQ